MSYTRVTLLDDVRQHFYRMHSTRHRRDIGATSSSIGGTGHVHAPCRQLDRAALPLRRRFEAAGAATSLVYVRAVAACSGDRVRGGWSNRVSVRRVRAGVVSMR